MGYEGRDTEKQKYKWRWGDTGSQHRSLTTCLLLETCQLLARTRVSRSGWLLPNAILAKCIATQYFTDTVVNWMSVTGTQLDKCSQLQRKNQQ